MRERIELTIVICRIACPPINIAALHLVLHRAKMALLRYLRHEVTKNFWNSHDWWSWIFETRLKGPIYTRRLSTQMVYLMLINWDEQTTKRFRPCFNSAHCNNDRTRIRSVAIIDDLFNICFLYIIYFISYFPFDLLAIDKGPIRTEIFIYTLYINIIYFTWFFYTSYLINVECNSATFAHQQLRIDSYWTSALDINRWNYLPLMID